MAIKLEDFNLSKKAPQKGTLQKVGIVGCGIMGQQIALQTSQYGIDVMFLDISEERIKEVMLRLGENLDGVIAKWGMTANEKKLILSRIVGTSNYEDLKDCDIVIETINSKKTGTSLEFRKDIFRKLEAVVRPDAVLASNTATLMISELAGVLKDSSRTIGLHFISPVRDVKIVEVVKSYNTSTEAYEFACKFVKMIGKTVINVNESPGNISTRMIIPFVNEACEILMEGVATVDAIDTTMREASGHLMGPFELADRIGLDKILRWMENMYTEFGQLKYKPSPIIKRMVRAGMVGKRAGEGFYLWKDDRKQLKKGPITSLGRE
jgi:3-hydroxybutyryl-CoA dehydrogenase